MKKILLPILALTLSCSAFAQSASTSVVNVLSEQDYKNPVQLYKGLARNEKLTFPVQQSGSHLRTTGTPINRWYSHYSVINEEKGKPFTTAPAQISQIPLWFDSSVTQRFYNGTGYFYGTINFCSVGQVIDPIHFTEFNDTILLNTMYAASGTSDFIAVSATDNYIVDSINIQAGYVRVSSKPSVVDTLILSVTPTKHAYIYGQTAWPQISHISTMLPSDTALVGFATINVDTALRAGKSDISTSPGQTWKVLLHATDGDTLFSVGGVSGYDSIKPYTYTVPNGGASIPAGYEVSITATFKSGEPTANIHPGIDSFNEYNHWMPVSAYEYPNTTGGYMTYWYDQFNDQNSSDLLFPKKLDYYEPTIYIQAHNDNAKFSYQYHNIQAHITCATCHSIGTSSTDTSFHHQGGNGVFVSNIPAIINTIKTFPNPANSQVTIAFTLSQSAVVNISLSNAIGQTVNFQKMGNVNNGKAVFNTAVLPAGVYFYTFTAGAERTTGRVIITH
ncbi:MAG: T9SS type A sorting domain-containing protein [Taibaiella sp.]|nr:T9SS type A sorting domain-containing protein [Taibaiella sp.]